MANSKYEYVRLFEQPDNLLANTWIVVRIDGRGFSKLTTRYEFVKPNDRNAADLMNAAAEAVMKELPDLVLAYGNSDEYSFVFHKDCALFERRASKLTTTITSTFTSYYVFLWSQYFPDKPLAPPLPSFDGRAVCYPSDFNLRDYMSWRQVDCHINNLYNTTFWALVQQGGMDARDAEQRLSGTVSSDKNEILFKEFGINYNNEPECFKKGTVLYRDVSQTFFPTSAAQPRENLTTIVSPQPRRVSTRRDTRAVETAIPFLQDQVASPAAVVPGPTFLSTTSTPSPPPSPQAMFRSALPNPLRSNPVVSPRNQTYPSVTMPLSPPSTVTSPMGNIYMTSGPGKQHFPNLIPLPLSPPILKPSTRPPQSLNAPNPTTRTNFSPTSPADDFPAGFQISGYSHAARTINKRPSSHSASASLTMPGPSNKQTPRLKQRSPSQPHLPSYFASSQRQPPEIPLRMSSIPTNNKPRKLSLQNHRSMSTIKPEKENTVTFAQHSGASTPRRVSPPLRTNKALPSPPMDAGEEMRTREKVMGSSPQEWSKSPTTRDSPPRRDSESYKRGGQVWPETSRSDDVAHPGIAELPATSTRRAKSHSRLHSAPVSSSLSYPFATPNVETLAAASAQAQVPTSTSPSPSSSILPPAPLKPSPPPPTKPPPAIPDRSKSAKAKAPAASKPHNSNSTDVKSHKSNSTDSKKLKASLTESGGWAAGTQPPMSRTQRDKERKKRSRAKVMIEHVDIIKDEFWDKRPWILSGKTG
ncbi:Thg1-domain-containing protein [Ophiobolus disseminans]|uniref:tRNA(His) guanylyltransferase n=1 Tax=Ophiobolus disseminans TaxID=1469910 RepID=A0A6A6ZGB6_9PLEO|nr:Thg1-domain-containing protein [Ophiobolus disseminans]